MECFSVIESYCDEGSKNLEGMNLKEDFVLFDISYSKRAKESIISKWVLTTELSWFNYT